MGGGNKAKAEAKAEYDGLSPRGRGKQMPALEIHQPPGSIPAWAGETPTIVSDPSGSEVYPRVGGGNNVTIFSAKASLGLSPRGRGKPG